MCRKTCLLGFSVELVYFFHIAEAQDRQESQQQSPLPTPSTGVIISVLIVMFCVTFLLLVYAKFCQSNPIALINGVQRSRSLAVLARSPSGLSGMDKTVIESLPFFKFSSIRGSKEGLECAICISKFEDDETLRMLPKCKHAFHMRCIDQWLASHSSCPLCRYKVDPEDLESFRYSFISRLLGIPSNLSEDLTVDIFVQREQENHQGSSSVDVNSRRFMRNMQKSEELEEIYIGNQRNISCDNNSNCNLWHKFNHRISLSGVVIRSRWSDLNYSDLLSLKSEMLMDASSKRLSNWESINSGDFHATDDDGLDRRLLCELNSPTDTREENSASVLNPIEKRSISEITNISRFMGISMKSRSINESTEKNVKEETLRRIWLPLARGTIQFFAGRQGRLQDQKYKTQVSYV